MPLAAGKLVVGHEERAERLATLAAQATLELSDTQCSMTGHGARAPSHSIDTAGEALGPPRRDAGLLCSLHGKPSSPSMPASRQLHDQHIILGRCDDLGSVGLSGPHEARVRTPSSFPRAVSSNASARRRLHMGCHPKTTGSRWVVNAGERLNGAAAPHGVAPSHRSRAEQTRYRTRSSAQWPFAGSQRIGAQHLHVVRALERSRLCDRSVAHAPLHLPDRRVIVLLHPLQKIRAHASKLRDAGAAEVMDATASERCWLPRRTSAANSV